MPKSFRSTRQRLTLLAALVVSVTGIASAQVTVTTVIVDPTQPAILVPHATWSGKAITLKGVTNKQGATVTYRWDPGDGTAAITGTVSNMFDVEALHAYTGTVGQSFTATLTVTDSATSTSASAPFYVKLFGAPPNLPVETEYAIDEGLWYLHKTMERYQDATSGLAFGDWQNCGGYASIGCAVSTYYSGTAANVNAFEVAGHPESTSPSIDPYADDVKRGLRFVFSKLTTLAIPSSITIPLGTVNPDINGNGLAAQYAAAGLPAYEGGIVMDAIVSSHTPTALVVTGPFASKTYGNDHHAATYADIVQDLVDWHSYCINTSDPFGVGSGGGWRYSCRYGYGDNSVNQWAAIGITAAQRSFGATIDPLILKYNAQWLTYSQNATSGIYGYTSNSPLWGPYATTPSGMVQAAMSGIGRGDPRWDKAETFIRDNFGNPVASGPTNSIKAYTYGLFSFTKSMINYDNTQEGGGPGRLQLLRSLDNAANTPLDWYAAQAPPNGTDPTNGVARTLIGIQKTAPTLDNLGHSAQGAWYGDSYSSTQFWLETSWSIIMLRSTVTETLPVAVATANPNQLANGGPSTLDGTQSFDPNPGKTIQTWQWDVSGTGGTNFTLSGSKVKLDHVTGAVGSTFLVRLRVTDNSTPPLSGDTVIGIKISNPPNPPISNPGGPYNFCPNLSPTGSLVYAPFILDGSASSNPDQGQTDGSANAIPSTIVAYDWDYSGGTVYNSAHGAQVDATTALAPKAGQSFNVALRVTNNDNLAFPTAGLTAGLFSVGSTPVFVHDPADPQCTHCVTGTTAKAKVGTPGVPPSAQLYWTDTNSAVFPIDHYNVYRSTNASFIPNVRVAGFGGAYPAIPVPAPVGALTTFVDSTVLNATTYYYRVAPATKNDTETCASPVSSQVTVKIGGH